MKQTKQKIKNKKKEEPKTWADALLKHAGILSHLDMNWRELRDKHR